MNGPTASPPGSVLVIGGANIDVLSRSRNPLQLHTSNPGVTVATAGGVGRNIAENLGRLGTPTRLVLSVGDDWSGRQILSSTRAAGVETLQVPWDSATGTYTAVLDADGGLVAGVADMAATEAIAPGHVPARWIEESAWLVLDGNLSPTLLGHALRVADLAGVPVALDPVSAPKAGVLAPLLRRTRVHTVTPTHDELVALTGERDPAAGAGRLLRSGVEVVWMRDGDRGSTLFRPDRPPEQILLPPVRTVDVTGAGDAMLAAYVHALVNGTDLTQAAYAGAAAALLTVRSTRTVRADISETLIEKTLADAGVVSRSAAEETR